MCAFSAELAGRLIARHEPDPGMRARGALSFQGFANYLMDNDNTAIKVRYLPAFPLHRLVHRRIFVEFEQMRIPMDPDDCQIRALADP